MPLDDPALDNPLKTEQRAALAAWLTMHADIARADAARQPRAAELAELQLSAEDWPTSLRSLADEMLLYASTVNADSAPFTQWAAVNDVLRIHDDSDHQLAGAAAAITHALQPVIAQRQQALGAHASEHPLIITRQDPHGEFPPLHCTLGLHPGHPELCIVGIDPGSAQGVLHEMIGAVAGGRSFDAGDRVTDLLADDLPIGIQAVDDEALSYLQIPPQDILHVLICDPAGLLPASPAVSRNTSPRSNSPAAAHSPRDRAAVSGQSGHSPPR